MWNIVANSKCSYGVKAFVCDTADDLNDLPTKTCKLGSSCFVISTSKTYMLNGQKEWQQVEVSSSNGGGGSSSGGDISFDYTIVDGGSATG